MVSFFQELQLHLVKVHFSLLVGDAPIMVPRVSTGIWTCFWIFSSVSLVYVYKGQLSPPNPNHSSFSAFSCFSPLSGLFFQMILVIRTVSNDKGKCPGKNVKGNRSQQNHTAYIHTFFLPCKIL